MVRGSLMVVLMVLGLTTVLLAQQGAADRYKPIAPFVNLTTTVVGYVEVGGVDPDGVGNWVLENAQKTLPADIRQDAQGFIRIGITLARQYRKELTDAGAPAVYWVLDDETMQKAPGYVVIPAGKNAESLSEKLQGMLGQAAVVWTAKDAVIVASKQVPPDAVDATAADRPEFAEAFATSKGQIVLVGTLTDNLRTQIKRNGGELPRELGGGSAVPLIDGYVWGMVDVQMPPQISARLLVHMKDKPIAAAMEQFCNKYFQFVQLTADGAYLAPIVKQLVPRLEDQTVVTELKSDQVPDVLTALGPALTQARERARQVQSMSNMRQLLMGVIMYQNDHNGAYPDKLDDVAKYLGGPVSFARITVNPLRPTQNPAYVYLKPKGKAADLKGASQTAMLYEAYDKWPGGVSVGFADGHVERHSGEAEVQRMIEDAGGNPPAKNADQAPAAR